MAAKKKTKRATAKRASTAKKATKRGKKKPRLSAKGREAIASAARRRWAKYRRDNGLPAKRTRVVA